MEKVLITGQDGAYLGKNHKIFLAFRDKMNKNLVTGGLDLFTAILLDIC